MKWNTPKYFNKRPSISKEISVLGINKSKGKKTQNESQFFGEFLDAKKIKVLWFLALLGPIAFFNLFYIINKKVYIEKGKKGYYYCDISRAKAERIAIFAVILTIIYVLIAFYLFQEIDARKLDLIYKNR